MMENTQSVFKFKNNLLSVPLSLATSLLSPAGKHARLSIAIYHRVSEKNDELLGESANATSFDQQVKYFTKYFNLLPLQEAVQRLQDATLPSRAACITFDDGYADNAEIALPILQKHGATATFFIASGFLNGGIMWNDMVIEWMRRVPVGFLDLTKLDLGQHEIDTLPKRRAALYSLIDALKYLPLDIRKQKIDELCSLISVSLPDDLMMTSAQVIKLHRAGMGIGGHTVYHPILARLSNDVVCREIAENKGSLEQLIKSPVKLFAYPNGKPNQDYKSEHIEILKNIGFDAAFTTAWGAAKNGCDRYQLPRFTPWTSGYLKFMLHMSRNMIRKVDMV